VVLFIFLCLEDFDLDTPHRMALGKKTIFKEVDNTQNTTN
jgi:hypothetical protein